MKCRYPIQLNVRGREIYCPCGKCAWCLSRKRDEWVYRMKIEAKKHLYNYFLTFTYRDEDLPMNVDEETGLVVNSVRKSDLSVFHHNIRRRFKLKFKFLVTSEYGSKTLRPHYHGAYFCDQPFDFEKEWPYGDNNVQLPLGESGMKYILKYMLKGSKVPDGGDPNFTLMSRRPGIGSDFDVESFDSLPYYLLSENSVKVCMPRYYKRKFYARLSDQLVQTYSDMTLDYLKDVERHGDLRRKWEDSKVNMPFEQWLDLIYFRDYKKQVLINNKEKDVNI